LSTYRDLILGDFLVRHNVALERRHDDAGVEIACREQAEPVFVLRDVLTPALCSVGLPVAT
jgi:hypothetical protein